MHAAYKSMEGRYLSVTRNLDSRVQKLAQERKRWYERISFSPPSAHVCPPLPPHLMLCSPRDKGQCRPPAPSWCTPRNPQSAGRTKAAIRGIHHMSLHLSELKKNWERPCSPLGSGLLGEIRQLRPSPSTYSGETEVSGGGIHSLLFLFSLKAADKSSCYIHPPVLQDAATFRAHMDARESKLSSDQTERTGTMASPPFSSVTCSSIPQMSQTYFHL